MLGKFIEVVWCDVNSGMAVCQLCRKDPNPLPTDAALFQWKKRPNLLVKEFGTSFLSMSDPQDALAMHKVPPF